MPVGLSNFAGKYDNGIAKLKWTTSFEQNLYLFEIERSYTGDNFYKVGSVNPAGNSQVNRNYTFNDSSKSSRIVYYRIKMIDNDRINLKYSSVINLSINKGIMVNHISPNPFLESININVDIVKDAALVFKLNDMRGKTIKTLNYPGKKGLNNVRLSNLKNISKGTYLVEIIADGEILNRQLIIKN